MVVRSSVRLLKIFGEESVQLEGGWRRRSWKLSVGLKYHCIAGPRQFKSGTLDTLSTSGPLCILIIPLRFLHCAAPIVHCARCRLCNAQSSEIVHSSLCLVGRCPPGTICQCREWHHRARQGKGESNRVEPGTLAGSLAQNCAAHAQLLCCAHTCTLAISDNPTSCRITWICTSHSWKHPYSALAGTLIP